ncbi:hypothetical protein [Gelidibacter gilvus]|uniref:Uncharacterized protein n=1 Tax=Gelidibacter gilvus TaxID=59602 RepID=A0A4Q0XG53_9FLAO|nr:hypothetical protein [Gelidibacter gilvus]RXJ50211.1 hypothetical protein ESZ48_09525 [Gelidibacter gilvus]
MSQRIYSNTEIQEKIAVAVKNLSDADLDKFLKKSNSKAVFDISTPLFLKVPEHFTETEKANALKDEKGVIRWTWDFEFARNGFAYAINTQWYARNDAYVERWLQSLE